MEPAHYATVWAVQSISSSELLKESGLVVNARNFWHANADTANALFSRRDVVSTFWSNIANAECWAVFLRMFEAVTL